MLAAIDAALGFRWIDWALFTAAHPWLAAAQRFAYCSHFWQPLFTIVVLAIWGPSGRNRELIMALLLALVATISISVFVPALGPAQNYRFSTPQDQIITDLRQIVIDLREGLPGPYPYSGMIWFPSFHTVMAVLFTAAHRSNRWTFSPVLALNLLMLSAIPNVGNHYLADVLGGVIVAALALAGARGASASCALSVWRGRKCLHELVEGRTIFPSRARSHPLAMRKPRPITQSEYV